MAVYTKELDQLEATFHADQRANDQFGAHFWRESKRLAAREGPDLIDAVMLRARKWQDEEGLVFVPLVSLLPRQRALAMLHTYVRSWRKSDRIWASEFLTEFEEDDTKAAVRMYSH